MNVFLSLILSLKNYSITVSKFDIHDHLNYNSLEYKDYTLNLWDVGGQKSIRTYWRNYFEMTDGIIWVVDSVDRFVSIYIYLCIYAYNAV
jgi:GTPase SAR1 family protein